MRKRTHTTKWLILVVLCFSVAGLLLGRTFPFLHASPPGGEVDPPSVPIHLLNNLCGCGNPDCDGTLTFCAGMGCPCDLGGEPDCQCAKSDCPVTTCGECPTDPCVCVPDECFHCNSHCPYFQPRCGGGSTACTAENGCLGIAEDRCFCPSYCPLEFQPCWENQMPPTRLRECAGEGCQGTGCELDGVKNCEDYCGNPPCEGTDDKQCECGGDGCKSQCECPEGNDDCPCNDQGEACGCTEANECQHCKACVCPGGDPNRPCGCIKCAKLTKCKATNPPHKPCNPDENRMECPCSGTKCRQTTCTACGDVCECGECGCEQDVVVARSCDPIEPCKTSAGCGVTKKCGVWKGGAKVCKADGCHSPECDCGSYYCKEYTLTTADKPYPCACWTGCDLSTCGCAAANECQSPNTTCLCTCTGYDGCPCQDLGGCGREQCT